MVRAAVARHTGCVVGHSTNLRVVAPRTWDARRADGGWIRAGRGLVRVIYLARSEHGAMAVAQCGRLFGLRGDRALSARDSRGPDPSGQEHPLADDPHQTAVEY